MSFFDNLFQNLFAKQEDKNSTGEVLVREMIKRNKVFLQEYEAWKEAELYKGMLEHLLENYRLRDADPTANVNFYLLKTNTASGFYCRAESPWNTKDYSFLIQLFIERLKRLEYHVNNSKREAKEEKGELKTEELFYLKPGLKFRRKLPYNQLFGNIVFEHKINGEETELLKMVVSTYSDRNFKEPYLFEDLMTELFLY